MQETARRSASPQKTLYTPGQKDLKYLAVTETEIDHQAKIIWDYMLLRQPLRPCDAILVLCGFDLRVAKYAVELFKQGMAPYIIFSGGGKGRITETLFEKSEAETFADVARKAGVPKSRIIIEDQSTNTGENLRFTARLLRDQHREVHSLIVVQKPYMERRAYATFVKQWPEPNTQFIVTSPPATYETYIQEHKDKHFLINAMAGDLQRIELYAGRGLQIPQKIPSEVREAYEKLIAAGYTSRLTKG